MRERKGCIYTELQRNAGKGRDAGQLHSPRYIRGVGMRDAGRIRFVGEYSYHGKRYRFRSTNPRNVSEWLNKMRVRFSD